MVSHIVHILWAGGFSQTSPVGEDLSEKRSCHCVTASECDGVGQSKVKFRVMSRWLLLPKLNNCAAGSRSSGLLSTGH